MYPSKKIGPEGRWQDCPDSAESLRIRDTVPLLRCRFDVPGSVHEFAAGGARRVETKDSTRSLLPGKAVLLLSEVGERSRITLVLPPYFLPTASPPIRS